MVLTSRLGTGVHRQDRRPRPWSRARRAARRPSSRARCHCRWRVTTRRHASHLQTCTRVEARLKHTCLRASAASTGQKRPVNSARRGGVPCGSAGQWPSMELAGRARAKGVRSARASLPVRSARPPGNQGASRGDMAARSISCTARSARRPATTGGPRMASAGPGAWVARELHTIVMRQFCGSKAGIQAWQHDGAPQRRRR
jgi:hypothetical protein